MVAITVRFWSTASPIFTSPVASFLRSFTTISAMNESRPVVGSSTSSSEGCVRISVA